MEPLDVASADWIKDYDPLFDLFDEDRQAEAAEADAFDAINMTDFSNLLFGLDWLDNELPVSYMTSEAPTPAALPPTSVSAPVTPALTQIQSETTSSSSSAYSSMAPSPISATTFATTTTTTSATTSVTTSITTSTSSDIGTKTRNNNKKRKTIKSKGTSLLAQPSPKTAAVAAAAVNVNKNKNNNILANVVTNGVVVSSNCGVITTLPIQLSTMASATTTTPITTTAFKAKTTTPTRLLSKNVPILQLSRATTVPQHPPSVFVSASTDSTTTATLLTYSNIDNLTRLGATTLATGKLAKIQTNTTMSGRPANIETIVPVTVDRRTLSGPEYTKRLCVSIEHDYCKKAR